MPDFNHYDLRSGDTYTVELDDAGTLLSILRYIGQVGLTPIVYDRLDEVPPMVRDDIQNKIELKKRKK